LITIDPPKQLLGRFPTHRRWILRDDRDPGVEEVSEQHIVESHQGSAVMQVEPVQGATGADAQQVLAGEERGRRLPQSQ